MDQTDTGAPGTIRTSDPQIRSLTQRSEKVRAFRKPASFPSQRCQCVRAPFANQNSATQRDDIWLVGLDGDATARLPVLKYEKQVASTRGPYHQQEGLCMSTMEAADTYSGLFVQLNADWRVVKCRDGQQWILQRRGSPEKGRRNDWRGRSYCRTAEALRRCTRVYAGAIDPTAAAPPSWPRYQSGSITPLGARPL